MKKKQTHVLLGSAGALAMLAGCASLPEPINQTEIKAIARNDREQSRRNIVPLAGPLSLEEAVARGLKYNLDHRTRLMEQALASGQLDAGGYDMLPRVLAGAGYQSRNNSANSFQPTPGTNSPSSTQSPVSADQTHNTTDIGLSWNILDFGMSYFNSKQNADRVLVAAERRRKAMHVLMQNIRSAFWRVASAQRLQTEVVSTIKESEKALSESRQVAIERVKAPAEALRFQRSLLDNLRSLEAIQRELAAASIELAQLINLPAGTPILVSEPSNFLLEDSLLKSDIGQLEELAIANNADIREQIYNARIAATETRKTLLRLFPALTVSYNSKSDSNSFLVNQSWQETAAQLSFNLINLLSGPSQMNVAEAGARLADQRRAAMQMAVITQMHLALQDFDTALKQFTRADAIWDVDRQLFELAAKGETQQTQSAQARIASRTAAILSQLRRYQALAQAHAAASRLDASLGLEPRIGNLDEITLTDLTKIIAVTLTAKKTNAPVPQQTFAPRASTPEMVMPPTSAEAPIAGSPAMQVPEGSESAAPTNISAGDTMARSVQPKAELTSDAPTSAYGKTLTRVTFVGNSKIATEELETAFADLIGQQLQEYDFARLPERAAAVYRDKGIHTVTASLAGRTGDGMVTIRLQQRH